MTLALASEQHERRIASKCISDVSRSRPVRDFAPRMHDSYPCPDS
jgi:hypothetical protein